MEGFSYGAVLLGVLVGSLWLEVVVRTRVLARVRRLILSIAPVLVVFLLWDVVAVDSGHWAFDYQRLVGIDVLAQVPLEEVLFFVVVPLAAILTFEAVRSVRGWTVGDEPVAGQDGSAR